MKREWSTYRLNNFSNGIVTNAATDQEAQFAADDILNWVPGRHGELVKIPIGKYLCEPVNGTNIAKVIHYRSKTGLKHMLSLESGALYQWKSGSATQISLPSQTPMVFTSDTVDTIVRDSFTFNDREFMLTGTVVNYCYDRDDGINIWGQNGIIPPVVMTDAGTAWAGATTYAEGAVLVISGYAYKVTTDGGGDSHATTEPTWPTTVGDTVVDNEITWENVGAVSASTAVSNLNYRYTFWDGRCESNPSPAAGTPLTSSTGVVSVKLWSGYSNVEQIRVYRYDAYTGLFRFVRGLDKTELSISDDDYYYFVDRTSDIDMSTTVELDNDPPPECQIGVVYQNHAFLAGDKRNPSRLYFSKLSNPFAFPKNRWVDIGGDDGDKIMALASTSNMLLIFKQNSLHCLIGTDVKTFEARYVASVGTVARRSVCHTPDGIYFVSHDGFYKTDGMGVEKVSYQISNLFKTETSEGMRNTTAIYVPYMQSIYFNIYKPWVSGAGVTYIYNIERRSWSRTTMGVVDGGTFGSQTYFSLEDQYYFICDSPYPTIQGELITKWMTMENRADVKRARRITVIGGHNATANALTVYYRTKEDASWTSLKSLTFNAKSQVFRFSTNIEFNQLQLKLTHTGALDELYEIQVEYRVERSDPLETT